MNIDTDILEFVIDESRSAIFIRDDEDPLTEWLRGDGGEVWMGYVTDLDKNLFAIEFAYIPHRPDFEAARALISSMLSLPISLD